jgi:S1-C subfamily serine protease
MKRIMKLFATILLISTLVACGTNINNIETFNQRDFYVYEEFELENLRIQINKKDGETEVVNINNSMLSSDDKQKIKDIGNHRVEINYRNHSTNMNINLVNGNAINKIFIDENLLAKTNIIEDFVFESLSLNIERYNGLKQTVPLTFNMLNRRDQNKLYEEGRSVLSVDFEDKTYSFTLNMRHKRHTVEFEDGDGKVLLRTEVIHNQSAVAPTEPTKAGYVFKGWDTSFDKITSAKKVKAIFEEKRYNANEIYNLTIDSVGEIEVFGKNGSRVSIGTGFSFLNNSTIITNYHVIEDGYSAKLKMNNRVYEVGSVLGYSIDKDIAILSIVGGNFKPLAKSSRNNATGNIVFAIGSSLGLTGSISSGIISQANRILDGVNYVQMTSPISPGNSGGPLLNEYGEVIGINTLSATAGDNIYFAVNINEVNSVSLSTPKTIAQVYDENHLEFEPYELNVQETEPNNTASQADLIQNGETYRSYMELVGFDYYRFNATRSGEVVIALFPEYTIDLPYIWFSLLDSNGTTILKTGSVDSDLALIFHNVTAGRTYYIRLFWKDSYNYTVGAGYDLFIVYTNG